MLGHRDTENADKNVGNKIMLGHRDIKNADNFGHRDTETVDMKIGSRLFYSRLFFSLEHPK